MNIDFDRWCNETEAIIRIRQPDIQDLAGEIWSDDGDMLFFDAIAAAEAWMADLDRYAFAWDRSVSALRTLHEIAALSGQETA